MTELGTTTRVVLSATAPFDLACSLRAMRTFTPTANDQFLTGDGRVRKAFLHPTHPSQAVVTEVMARDDGEPGVAMTVHSGEPLTPAETTAVATAVTNWLGLDDARADFLAIARTDPAMARLLPVAEGLHQVCFPTLTEAAAYFTLTHRSTAWYAAARKRRLVDELGPWAVVEGRAYTAFPTAAVVTALDEHGLLPFTGSKFRAERLLTVLSGLAELDEAALRTAPYEEARATLLAVRGIGTFTAHALLLRALGRPDAVPLERTQFTKTALALYGEPAPTPADLRRRYGPWIGWWAYTARTALGWVATPDSSDAPSPPPVPLALPLAAAAA
ncbi:hypothetical protein KZZ52_04065 [Dactylosporangium sp. AC04546]|uniref:DNA-3-methyladenine glycosylase family protein n=1 Tax=Dactylosporangium sp. AC04546 TaxID=2862460 RepID=UPI001EDF8C36|nr:hypothetical protein [Dactylosporangium sp. AC04546]WVK84607.1 hypothetical protein KZZ52_04065 [Dactylosporangium sp. AC04546]